MYKKIKILFGCLLFPSLFLLGQVEFPELKYYVNDYTGTLTRSEISSLNSLLKTFEDSTSDQVVFLMINSLQGYSLEMFTYEVASKNKIGTKKNNNGILFFVAKEDRKMRIEVGYGLEGVLPDALASSILRNEVKPYFKKDDYYSGIQSGLTAITAAIKGEYKNDSKGEEDEGKGFSFIFIIIIIIILIITRGGGRRGGGNLATWLLLSSLGSSSRRGGSWGGSSGGFGGGFGGFSGGGGSFGGGGSSGSW